MVTVTAALLLSAALTVQVALLAAAAPALVHTRLPLTLVPGPAMVGTIVTTLVMSGPAVTLIVAVAWSQATGLWAGFVQIW
jgi:hypothetical protein